jgi:adenosylcobinamide kinase/adenosylcobinamide-phosphate guanylyltransferase
MEQLILILGGARSGKSAYAQRLARELGGDAVLVVATAAAGDEEMAQRIARHQQSRPPRWRTLERPSRIGAALHAELGEASVVLVDCLTLLVSNVMLAPDVAAAAEVAVAAVQAEIEALLQVCRRSTATFIIVSNEVGLGLVPDTPFGRLYRDLLGQANQTLAAQARTIYLMVAGLAVDVKRLASPQGE